MVKGFDELHEGVGQVIDLKRVLNIGCRVLAKEGNARVGFKGELGDRLAGAAWLGWSNDCLEVSMKKSTESWAKYRLALSKWGVRVLADCKSFRGEGKVESGVSCEYTYEDTAKGKVGYKLADKEFSAEIMGQWQDFVMGAKIRAKEGVNYVGGVIGWISKMNETILRYEAPGFELGNLSVLVKSEVRPDFVIGSKVEASLKGSANKVRVGCLHDLGSQHRIKAVVGHEGDVLVELRKIFNRNLTGRISGGFNLNDLVSNKGIKQGVGLRFDYTNS